MATKSRRNTQSDPARQNHRYVARTAAGSHAWTTVAYIHPAVYRPVSAVQRTDFRRTSPRQAPAPRRHSAPQADYFGSWTLYPPPLPQKALRRASVCARRHIRREVLFATRSTGAGSNARRLHFSNMRC